MSTRRGPTHSGLTYEAAKQAQARLYKQGVFAAVVREEDAPACDTYKLEMPGGPRTPADLALKRRAKLHLVKET